MPVGATNQVIVEVLRSVSKQPFNEEETQMLRKPLLAILIMAPMLSGCALITGTAPLTYRPEKNVAVLPRARNIVVRVVVKNDKARKRVGSKKNGFGESMAAIYAKEPISKTVQSAIEEELAARGFGTGSNGPVVVNAIVKEFHNTFHLGLLEGEAVARLNMAVTVLTKGRREVFSKDILATGKTSGILASGSNAAIALDRALHAGMKTLFGNPAFIQALLTARKESPCGRCAGAARPRP